VEQFFVLRAVEGKEGPPLPLERQMYVLRKLVEHRLRTSGLTEDDCYVCSLSSRTIVYKGQLTPEQARAGGYKQGGRGGPGTISALRAFC
jgi:glutamate synthase (NADPH/NADH)